MAKVEGTSVEEKEKTIQMSKIVIEKSKYCKFVQRGYTVTGHDCWGCTETSDYRYVWFEGKEEHVYDGSYIMHDGEKVLGTGSISCLDEKFRKHLDKDCVEKLKERRYKEYLTLDKEFGNDPV